MNARLALLFSSSLSNWQVRIYKGLKWRQALIQITLPLSCSHHGSMHAALAFFLPPGTPILWRDVPAAAPFLARAPEACEKLEHSIPAEDQYHSRGSPYPQTPACTLRQCEPLYSGAREPFCAATGRSLAWGLWFTLKLVGVWLCNYTKSFPVLQNSLRLFPWAPQLVSVGILDIRCSAVTEIINFSKCCLSSFFVNRW